MGEGVSGATGGMVTMQVPGKRCEVIWFRARIHGSVGHGALGEAGAINGTVSDLYEGVGTRARPASPLMCAGQRTGPSHDRQIGPANLSHPRGGPVIVRHQGRRTGRRRAPLRVRLQSRPRPTPSTECGMHHPLRVVARLRRFLRVPRQGRACRVCSSNHDLARALSRRWRSSTRRARPPRFGGLFDGGTGEARPCGPDAVGRALRQLRKQSRVTARRRRRSALDADERSAVTSSERVAGERDDLVCERPQRFPRDE